MLLKSKKHIILIFSVLLMLIIIPTSFAGDVNDNGTVIGSADDAPIAGSVGNVNDALSVSDDSEDVLGDDIVFSTETTPDPTYVDSYSVGDSQIINVTTTSTWAFITSYDNWGETMYYDVFINDFKINTTIPFNSYSTTDSFTYDLANIDSFFFDYGENTLTFGLNPDNMMFYYYDYTHQYNPLTVNVVYRPYYVGENIILAPDVEKYYNGPERFNVTVTDSKGNPLANKTVEININKVNYTKTTDENGTASIALSLPSSIYNASVTVDNQTVNSTVTILPTVNGTDVVKVYKNATQYYATFKDSEGNFLANGTAVQFNINGVMYDRKVSGDKGLAKLNINLPQGEYVITAINPETGENAANNITVLPRLAESKDITKYYKNATQYTVKVIGDDGNAVGAGEEVTFNINGVLYTQKTNESGIAQLNINLPPGDYIITAEYQGFKVANDIKVLPVLSASDMEMKYHDGSQFKAYLVDGQGKAYANQKIQFNINGVFYCESTDSEGIACLNINLMSGKYIITSSYNGLNIANTVTVHWGI